ncbi:XisH protein [Calothrix sp. NIES-3974]|nr:XisH protein [Calothrix sp. NIES-3974]
MAETFLSMPPKDLFHDIVKRALEKDGWIITHEQLPLSFE